MEEVKLVEDAEELTIALSGEIDFGKSENFFNTVMEYYRANPTNVCFDCESLEFIDSTTLGTFVKILKAIKVDGREMRLKNLQPKIKKLFVISALDTIIQIA